MNDWPKRLRGWTSVTLADAAFPNDVLMQRKLRDNFGHWIAGKSNPGPLFFDAVTRALNGQEPSPVNRLAASTALELPPPSPRRAPPQFGFMVEADGQVRITLNILTTMGPAFRIMDALRGAGLLAEDSA